ncbi:hypothetical protein [Gephyromycinifex aptenodytis]|uniref:hypothetical protein n=1 Tax=Gephyromycinifex aptenodytis TaxID=2716227 RepID=UPI001446D1F7|nr:hypothetical protein [Gephyromycinifex aptenodytis]
MNRQAFASGLRAITGDLRLGAAAHAGTVAVEISSALTSTAGVLSSTGSPGSTG